MNNKSLENLTDYVEQTATLINLPLDPNYRPGVIANFERIAAIAQLVNEFPLPETIEIAPTFDP